MSDYSFLTIWQFDAPINRVWQVISDAARYPQWWKYVVSVDDLAPGEESGVGRTQRYRWKTALPYTLDFETRVTRVDPPHLLEARAIGELAGFGRWELAEEAGATTVRYTWNVRTSKLWMNLLAPIARPLFAWNHDQVMSEGGESLARELGARLLRNESVNVGESSPGVIMPLLSGAALGSATALITRRVLRRR